MAQDAMLRVVARAVPPRVLLKALAEVRQVYFVDNGLAFTSFISLCKTQVWPKLRPSTLPSLLKLLACHISVRSTAEVFHTLVSRMVAMNVAHIADILRCWIYSGCDSSHCCVCNCSFGVTISNGQLVILSASIPFTGRRCD